MIELLQVETSHGPARARLERPAGAARGLLAMSHGAGGGIDAADLVAVAGRAVDRGFVVALVEQPYRVAGRRAPAPAKQLDTCWREVIAVLRKELGDDVPLVVGGRSMGARVACRTANDVGADAVLCLAFPLQPRPRKGRVVPDRLHELDAVEVPVLVVQGERDPFGIPPAARGRTLVVVAGDHSLAADVPAVVAATGEWLVSVPDAAAG